MIYNLAYYSTPRDGLNDEDIAAILKVARKYNKKNDISGILIYENNLFLQILEGEKDRVKDLFDRIRKDPRHHNIQPYVQSLASDRIFRDWSMAYKNLNTLGLHWVDDLLKLGDKKHQYFESLKKIREQL
ncbi:Sensors of blue-light using FAD [Pseudobacteriovorax antillogorgiicola]|uniref:Sensors of blue-light using FAD n=1 Tax=Pseudobacteriovorax antillogorgiicola TaxID=1513793 RepID=A0A1Y6CL86_9BACT|nr:FAD-dependent sensor of blue light [Pseudobacteriovorax antillogorgiicola]SMF73781.1 Sensors of blue-light using FAD [Pseudobacteriovorax antillogorgiicola]